MAVHVCAARCGVICTRLPSISVRIFIKVNKCVFETTIFEIANADWICYCCCGYTCHCCCRFFFCARLLTQPFQIASTPRSILHFCCLFYCIQHIDYIILLLDFPLFSEDASLSPSFSLSLSLCFSPSLLLFSFTLCSD